jgi:cytochrome c oxidase subunit 1
MSATNSHTWSRHGATGWRDYFTFNTDHKVIGVQYIVVAFVFFMIGGLLAEIMRLQLMSPDNTLVGPDLYNQLFSVHGTVMIFLWIIPLSAGLANYMIPLLVISPKI